MYDSPFTPLGPTYLVGTSPVLIQSSSNTGYSSVRCLNTAASVTRISWVVQPNPPNNMSTAAPTAGAPVNVITIPASGVAIVGLPNNAWMCASQASVEVTPGEGM